MKRPTTASVILPFLDEHQPSAEARRQAGALARARRMSRIFRTIDVILPAQNAWREYRYLVSRAVLFFQALGLHRITRRCPPGGSAASPRHQQAARACPPGTAADGRCETLLPPPCRAHSIPSLAPLRST